MKIVLLSLFFLFIYPGKRQILLFYNDRGTALHAKQLFVLQADKKGLQERDILICSYKMTEEKAMADRWKVRPDKAFTFILLGKDGGEKLRADSTVSLAQLYKTIDAMPMRRDEMKEKK